MDKLGVLYGGGKASPRITMPRRELLTSGQREALLAFPREEAELLRYYTTTPSTRMMMDFSLVEQGARKEASARASSLIDELDAFRRLVCGIRGVVPRPSRWIPLMVQTFGFEFPEPHPDGRRPRRAISRLLPN
jgi:hypothetical protein